MKTYRKLCVLVVAVLLAIPLTSRSTHAEGKVLRSAGREFPGLDPQATGITAQATLENALFRGLLRYDEKGNPAPSIAQDVPSVANGGISSDGKTYTYKLRDWNWSDGKGKVTAQDFVYSYERLVDPKFGSPYGYLLSGIVVNADQIQAGKAQPTDLGVKAVDEKTFQVSLVQPTSYFNAIASMWVGFAVRKDNVERANLPQPTSWTDPANGEVVGSGPFIIKSWDHKKEIVLEKNPNYSGTAPKLDTIKLEIIDDPQLAYASYKNDELEISGAPAAEIVNIKADPTLSKELAEYKVACTNYLAMDNGHPPFDNKKVREAFTYALDRDLREKIVDKGLTAVTYSWLPDGVPGYDPKLGMEYAFNVAKAQQALADAGFPGGQNLPEILYNYAATSEGQRTADWYKEQFKQVLNVDLKLNPMDLTTYTAALNDARNKLTGMFEYGWCADYLHPSDWMQLVFGTGQANNVANYSDPQFDTLSKAADAEPDQAKSMDLYAQAHKLLLSDFPVIFMQTPTAIKLVKPRVKNLKPNSLDGGVIGGFFWEDIDVAS